jgi:hypothetical protein
MYVSGVTRAAAAVMILGSWLLLGVGCRRDPPPPALLPAASPSAPAPAAPPAPDTAPSIAAAAPSVEEAPLTPCQRKCSITANHKQLQGFLRCEKAGADLEPCKAKVLEDTDAGRRACRERCQGAARP